jgi:isoamylase
MEADPELSDLKMISEPWDCGGLYRLADFPARRVATWNGRFRDDLRRFWKGDDRTCWPVGQRLSGSPDLFTAAPVRPGQCITFLTAHDGFTLADLVSFNGKHNLANGEDNRDGDNHNNSWNHGVEGPSTDNAISVLRDRQIRNLLASLLLAPGVPMLLMGDEVRRSQGGNNNTWCQDNPLGWMHWQPDAEDLALRTYVIRLLTLRRHLAALLNPEAPFLDGLVEEAPGSEPSHLWREWHGVELRKPDWASWSHTLAWSLHDPHHGALLWCGMNAYGKAMHFDLPRRLDADHRYGPACGPGSACPSGAVEPVRGSAGKPQPDADAGGTPGEGIAAEGLMIARLMADFRFRRAGDTDAAGTSLTQAADLNQMPYRIDSRRAHRPADRAARLCSRI